VWVACLAIIGGLVGLFWPRRSRACEPEPRRDVSGEPEPGSSTDADDALEDALVDVESHRSPVEPG
jgi:hypothetical protein